jgi:hypothetical protein
MRYFADLRKIDRFGDQADFSLSHGAVELAAELALADIGTFETEKAAKRWFARSRKLSVGRPFGLVLLARDFYVFDARGDAGNLARPAKAAGEIAFAKPAV